MTENQNECGGALGCRLGCTHLIYKRCDMKCRLCEEEFELIKTHGGQNRQACYNCIPLGLTQSQREKIIKSAIKQKANEYKLLKGCSVCGYKNCAEALEWHHNNDDKSFDPSTKLMSRGFIKYELYLKEIEKCELLCANCHREKHYIKGGIV